MAAVLSEVLRWRAGRVGEAQQLVMMNRQPSVWPLPCRFWAIRSTAPRNRPAWPDGLSERAEVGPL